MYNVRSVSRASASHGRSGRSGTLHTGRARELGSRSLNNICTVLLALTLLLGSGCHCPHRRSVTNPADLVLEYEWVGDIDKLDFNEPSGIAFDSTRGTLFLVGDEGQICEIQKDGTPINEKVIRAGADFEGITLGPASGLLYVAIEGDETIIEVDADSFAVLREWEIERSLGDVEVLRPGGNGIEGIEFVPDANHPEGGTFFVTNQSFTLEPDGEKSVVVQIEVPLRSRSAQTGRARILRFFSLGVIDLSGLHYERSTGHLYVISDATNTLYEIDLEGRCHRALALPGNDQEGLALDDEGYMYIAQDCGGVIKIKPLW